MRIRKVPEVPKYHKYQPFNFWRNGGRGPYNIKDLKSTSVCLMAFKRKFRKFRRSKKSRRGRFTRKGRKSFKARVTQVLMKKVETKYYDIGVEDVQLYHNLGRGSLLPPSVVTSIPQFFNPWSNIVQGTSRFTRIGDTIIPRGISLKLYIANKFDRPNTMVRIIVAVLPKSYAGAVVPYDWNPFQLTNSGVLNNHMLLVADHDKGVKFLYNRVITMQTAVAVPLAGGAGNDKENTRLIKLWIKSKKGSTIKFDTTSASIVNRPIAIYAIPYEQFSTSQLSNTTSIAGNMRLYYKDP